MPNWASITYKCVGDPKEIRQLHGVLRYIEKRKTTIVPNGFGKWWLGNLVTKLGGNWENYSCRGDIVDYSQEDKTHYLSGRTPLGGNKRGYEGSLKRNCQASKFISWRKSQGVSFLRPIPTSISQRNTSSTPMTNQCTSIT